MECLECSWNQLYHGIIINAGIALFIAIIFKFIIIPKIEIKYERNEFNVHVGVMGFVNSFDDVFKWFYELFEQHMGNIRDLNEGEWLPDPYQGWVKIDGGEELKRKSDTEYDKAVKIRKKFGDLDQTFFIDDEERLRGWQKTLSEYIEKNENYIDPELRRHIKEYIDWTVSYVGWLRGNQNQSGVLCKRSKHAKKIIQLLKKEQSFGNRFTRLLKREKFENIPQIGEFAKKWQDYEKYDDSSACMNH